MAANPTHSLIQPDRRTRQQSLPATPLVTAAPVHARLDERPPTSHARTLASSEHSAHSGGTPHLAHIDTPAGRPAFAPPRSTLFGLLNEPHAISSSASISPARPPSLCLSDLFASDSDGEVPALQNRLPDTSSPPAEELDEGEVPAPSAVRRVGTRTASEWTSVLAGLSFRSSRRPLLVIKH